MILMEKGEMLYSLELLIKNFNVFEHFGRALRPDAQTENAPFRAICLAKCVVGEVDRTETRVYRECGNKRCEARAAMDGNCVTCRDEASHPRWFSSWVVDADAASGVQDVALEFKGRSALKKVKGVYLLPNAAQPERVEMNDAICDQFYEGREMDLIGSKRPMESTEGILSDPVVHVVVWRWSGEEVAESSPVKVFGSTLGSRYDPVHFRDFAGNANEGTNVGGGNHLPPPLPNLGGRCATNSMLRMLCVVEPLVKEVTGMDALAHEPEVRQFLKALQHCLNRIIQGKPPVRQHQVLVDTLVKQWLTREEREDVWGNGVTYVRHIARHLALFCCEMQCTWQRTCKVCKAEQRVPDAVTHYVLEMHAVSGDEGGALYFCSTLANLSYEGREILCATCEANTAHACVASHRILGSVLFLSVNYPERCQEAEQWEPRMHAVEIPDIFLSLAIRHGRHVGSWNTVEQTIGSALCIWRAKCGGARIRR